MSNFKNRLTASDSPSPPRMEMSNMTTAEQSHLAWLRLQRSDPNFLSRHGTKISRYGVSRVYEDSQATVDVVLVHGLNGHPYNTWEAPDKTFWPQDLLPAALRGAHANVLVYGYNADVYSTQHDKSASDNFILNHAQTLVTELAHWRMSSNPASTDRPIVWVAHSLGGILVKKALIYANELKERNYQWIKVCTYGIIFLGTPHTGSDLATWGHIIQAMADAVVPKKFLDTESILLKTLKKDNETLQNINSSFLQIYQDFKIHMVHENHKTDLKGTKAIVVDANSASPQLAGVVYYGIEATHVGMCKFDSLTAPGFRTVSTAIGAWALEAPEVIRNRCELEDSVRDRRDEVASITTLQEMWYKARGQLVPESRPYEQYGQRRLRWRSSLAWQKNQALEPDPLTDRSPRQSPTPLEETSRRSPSYGSPRSSHETVRGDQPPFIHPDPFRPNSFFKGRENELRQLHDMLMDKERRKEGTSAVLIQSMPGGGKTHLARQYVYQYRDKYPGGIFWVQAKSRGELEIGFRQMAKHDVLQEYVDDIDVGDPRDATRMVEAVREYLNNSRDWLLVLDDVHFDLPGLKGFIPDSADSAIVYTSTERAVTGDPDFDNPRIIELGLLDGRAAQELLLEEMERPRPWAPDELDLASQVTEQVGRLPYMIHGVAWYLKTTGQPVSEFLDSYRARAKIGFLSPYKQVIEQLIMRNAVPAMNLMCLLAFFDQSVPVRMLLRGEITLDKKVPISTHNPILETENLNNTFSVLLSFALITRTERPRQPIAIGPRPSSSAGAAIGAGDVVHLHTVVQSFFIEYLANRRELPVWLGRAVDFFCASFDWFGSPGLPHTVPPTPDHRVADYRLYRAQAARLLRHIVHFDALLPPEFAATKQRLQERIDAIDALIISSAGTPSHALPPPPPPSPPHIEAVRPASAPTTAGPQRRLPWPEEEDDDDAVLFPPDTPELGGTRGEDDNDSRVAPARSRSLGRHAPGGRPADLQRPSSSPGGFRVRGVIWRFGEVQAEQEDGEGEGEGGEGEEGEGEEVHDDGWRVDGAGL